MPPVSITTVTSSVASASRSRCEASSVIESRSIQFLGGLSKVSTATRPWRVSVQVSGIALL